MPNERSDRRAERRQQRLIKRRNEAMPLFVAAGIADQVQAIPAVDDIAVRMERRQRCVMARRLGMLAADIRKWAELRIIAERYLTQDQVAHIEAYCRRTYPSYRYEPVYRVDYWWRLLHAMGVPECQTWEPAYPLGLHVIPLVPIPDV